MGLQFQSQITLEDFLHVLADVDLPQILQIGQSLQKKDAFDQQIGMLHLIDGLVILVLVELVEAPVFEHAGMQKVLIDGCQLIDKTLVEIGYNLRIPFHGAYSLTLNDQASLAEAVAGDNGCIWLTETQAAPLESPWRYVPDEALRTSLAVRAQRPHWAATPSSLRKSRMLQQPLLHRLVDIPIGHGPADTHIHDETPQ
jgi:hypothetical protein